MAHDTRASVDMRVRADALRLEDNLECMSCGLGHGSIQGSTLWELHHKLLAQTTELYFQTTCMVMMIMMAAARAPAQCTHIHILKSKLLVSIM